MRPSGPKPDIAYYRSDRFVDIAPHTGGGFGVKGWVWPHQILTAAAARVVGRPTKVMLTRAQMYGMVSYQAIIHQDLAVGCAADGRLTAVNMTRIRSRN